MCQIIIKPKGLLTNLKKLDVAQAKNSHGCGAMWFNEDTKELHIFKSLDYAEFKEVIIHKVGTHSAVIHFRLASKGKVTLDNVHPFETSKGGYLCHNGTMTSWGNTEMSDTLEFANTFKELDIDWHNQAVDTLVGHIIGTAYNKIVVMMDDGFVKVFNENLFIKEEGILYSNTSHHEYKPYTYEYPKSYYKTASKELPSSSKQSHWWDDEDEYYGISTINTKPKETIKVFVYGSLKRGKLNHTMLGDSKFLGEAQSVDKWAMIDRHDGAYPYLLGEYEGGLNVIGEVYEVDEDTKEVLDILEGTPIHYMENEIDVQYIDAESQPYGDIITCSVYTKSNTTKHPSIINTVYKNSEFIKEW